MIRVIALHELRVLSRSPFAWIAAALLQLVFSWLFLAAVEQFIQMAPATASRTGGLSSYLVVQFLTPASIVMMLATPLICMNLIAAERQTGRFSLLASSPVSATQIVLGKFLGATTFQLSILALSALLIAILTAFTSLDAGHLFSAAIGLALFITAATALTLFCSSLTNKPALAAFISFTTLLLLWLAAASGTTGSLAGLSPSAHLTSFMQGILDTRDISYFLCSTGVLVYLTIWRLDSPNRQVLPTPNSVTS